MVALKRKFFKTESWRGQEPVRQEIDSTEAQRIIDTRRSHGPIYLQHRPQFDGEVTVETPLVWGDLYSDWLHLERGSWASWEGPQCSYGYFTTYVRPDARYRHQAIPGRYRTIRHMPLPLDGDTDV